MIFETLIVDTERSLEFAEIDAQLMNLLSPKLVRDLAALNQQAKADESARVHVLKSVDTDYFISHVDVSRIKEYRAEAAKLTGEASIAPCFDI